MTWNITITINNLTPYYLKLGDPLDQGRIIAEVLPQGQWQWGRDQATVRERYYLDDTKRLQRQLLLARDPATHDMAGSLLLTQIQGVEIDRGVQHPGLLPVRCEATVAGVTLTQKDQEPAMTWRWDALRSGGDIEISLICG